MHCLKLFIAKKYFKLTKYFWGYSKWQKIRVLQVWTEICHQIFGGWEVKTMWIYQKNVWCAEKLYFIYKLAKHGFTTTIPSHKDWSLSEGVHRRTSFMSLSLLLQQCPVCLVHLIWMVLEMGCWQLYNCLFVGCCFQDLLNITHSILVQFSSSFFSIFFVSIYVVYPYNRIDTTAAWKKLHFILWDR